MPKKERLKVLKEIVAQENVQKQEDFVFFLKARGIKVTQATVSRDIAELQLIKKSDLQGSIRYYLPNKVKKSDEDFYQAVLMIQDIVVNDKELMLKVFPGSALRIKQVLLSSLKDKIFAAIADDDGIFIKTWSKEDAQAILQAWQKNAGSNY
jgi:transcriptional regulator of arginine metabolism